MHIPDEIPYHSLDIPRSGMKVVGVREWRKEVGLKEVKRRKIVSGRVKTMVVGLKDVKTREVGLN